jgi:F0F1-type ATP synthase assembly protein I
MKRKNNLTKDVGPYLNSGFQLITPILIGILIGHRMDRGLEFPLWTLVLSIIGIALGLYGFISTVLKNDKKSKK